MFGGAGMIKLFSEVDNKLTCVSDQEGIFEKIEKNMWVHIFEPKPSDVVKLSEITGIDKDLLLSALDEEE